MDLKLIEIQTIQIGILILTWLAKSGWGRLSDRLQAG